MSEVLKVIKDNEEAKPEAKRELERLISDSKQQEEQKNSDEDIAACDEDIAACEDGEDIDL